MSIQLPGGGRIDVTDHAVVPMGDVHAYRQLTYSHDGSAGKPACEIVFEVRAGVPMCTRLAFTVPPDSRIGLRAKDLKAIKLDDLRDDVYGYAGVFEPNPSGGLIHKVGRGSFHQDRKHVERATQRRKITSQFLEQVAEIHNDAPAGGRLEAVQAAFKVRERQALRYIAQARQKGLINE
jgi:hypothetical protein